MSQDVIVSSFACGGKMKCSKEIEAFSEPPALISVSGGSIDGFVETAQSYNKNDSILDGFLSAKLKGIVPRRICLVSFSDGWSWISSVLKCKKDIDRIDTIIVVDGIYTFNKCWVDFANKAAKGNSPKLWLAHCSRKVDNCVTPKTTNNRIYNAANTNGKGAKIPTYILNVELEKIPTTIYSKDEIPRHKLYHEDTLIQAKSKGNLVLLSYDGDKIQDQIYLQQYVQPRLWRWLREIWTDPDVGVCFTDVGR